MQSLAANANGACAILQPPLASSTGRVSLKSLACVKGIGGLFFSVFLEDT